MRPPTGRATCAAWKMALHLELRMFSTLPAPPKLPAALQRHVVAQDYTRYDAADQATWRFVLLHLVEHLRDRAHPRYLEGLQRTGLSTDAIPRIEHVDQALSTLGWRAVCVSGFVPPRAFQRFQALRVLPIAGDIRTPWHVAYTPAPDIIHEAAGHAPLLVDREYGDYLERVGRLGELAFSSRHDLELHEAVARLSDLKERTSSDDPTLVAAEAHLERLTQQRHDDSEATRMSRLYWWTAEYGLLGTPRSFRAYGAGLLSSLGEAVYCESPEVRKLPLSVDCLDVAFDITRPQPQLFVVEDFTRLFDVLDEAEAQLAARQKCLTSLRAAIDSALPARVLLSSGHALHGRLSEIGVGSHGEPVWLRATGACRLLRGDNRTLMMNDDLVLPLGVPEEDYDPVTLEMHVHNRRALELRYPDGLRVRGLPVAIERADGPSRSDSDAAELGCLLTLQDAELELPDSVRRYERFVLPFAARALGALPDDEEAQEQASSVRPPGVTPALRTLSARDRTLRDLYARASQAWNELPTGQANAALIEVHEQLQRHFPDDWLLRWNLLESLQKLGETEHTRRLDVELQRLEALYERRQPIATGLRTLHRRGSATANVTSKEAS